MFTFSFVASRLMIAYDKYRCSTVAFDEFAALRQGRR
jgi:hypothetical protein